MKRRKDAADSPEAPTGRSSGEPARDLLDVVGSDLLDFGQLIIAGMKMTTGDGSPDTGVQFVQGREGFDIAGQTLGSAGPDDRWDGIGARAYADQNTRQRVRTETMADADRAVHSVLVRESLQIRARRDTLDTQSDLLAKTSYATYPLQFIPRYGEAAKLAIESAALQASLQLCAFALYGLHSEVSDNAIELRQALGRYAAVADGADPPGDGVDFNPPPTPGSGGPTNTAPEGPPVLTDGGGGAAIPGSAPQDTSGGGLPPRLDPPRPDLPAEPSASAPASAPQAPTTGMPGPGGAAGALASIVGPLAGLVTGIAPAAGEAASAGERAQVDADDDEEDTVTAEEVRDGDPGDQVAAAEPGHGLAARAVGAEFDPHSPGPNAPATDSVILGASAVPYNGPSPQDTKLGEGEHVGG